MVTQQLRDYVKQQLQANVAKDAIRTTLLGIGWSAADANEALGGTASPVASSPISSLASPTASPAAVMPTMTRDVFPAKTPEKSAAFSFGSMSATPSAARAAAPASSAPSQTKDPFVFKTKSEPAVQAVSKTPVTAAASVSALSGKKSGNLIFLISMGVVTLASVGAAIFFFMNSGSASSQSSALTSQNADLTGKIASLNANVADASTKINSLTADNQELLLEVAIFATANIPAASGGDTSAPITASGTIGGGNKAQYTLTTPHGIVLYIKNSKDAKVDAALKPLVGNVATVAGTHIPGYRDVTATIVNGQSLSAAPVAGAASSTGTAP